MDKCIAVDTGWFRYVMTTFEYHISKNIEKFGKGLPLNQQPSSKY